MKIVHLPYNYGSAITALKYAEEKLGATSSVLAHQNKFIEKPDHILSRMPWKNPLNWLYFIKARNADILVFNGGSSLIDPPLTKIFLCDLPFYKKVPHKAVIFQGSDIRIHYPEAIIESRIHELSLGRKLSDGTPNGLISKFEIERKTRRVEKFGKHVDRFLYFNPDLSNILPSSARFVPYPIWQSEKTNVPKNLYDGSRPLRVLHTSTNRVLKGTGLIELALRTAKTISNIDVKILVRTDKKSVFDAMNWADVLVDQMCLGWYGAQAAEALELGLPVFCNINQKAFDELFPNYLDKMTGFINTDHKNLPDSISNLSADPEQYRLLSQAARNFVKDVHDPRKSVEIAYGDWL